MVKIGLQKLVPLCSILFAVFTVCLSLYFLFASHAVTVIFDGTGFSPKELTVEIGTRVVFKNESEGVFWPASSLHPYHSIFPAFDPKMPIGEGKTWSFVFDEPGLWSYHDHVRPQAQGTITVKDSEGSIPPLKCESFEERRVCQEKEMHSVLEMHGLQAAFDYVATLFDTDEYFKQQCHEVLHSLGQEAYSLYTNGEEIHFSNVTTYCGYGFFHGFIEGVIAYTGSLDEAQKFCESFNVEKRLSATEACYHGIGHGVLDGSDPSTWGDPMAMILPALSICLKVSLDAIQQDNCGTGAFNALVDFAAQGAFDLSISPEEAYSFCARITEHIFKIGCYVQMNVITGYREDRSLIESFEFLKTITEEEYVEPVVRTMAGAHAKAWHSDRDYERIIKSCRTLKKDFHLSCIEGYAARLMDFGPIGDEYKRGVDLCNIQTLLVEEKDGCVDFIGRVAIFGQAEEVREARCLYIKDMTGRDPLFCERG